MKADLVDETYEVLDAIDRDDPDALADELGDVLLHIAMHAAIGQEHGEFTIRDVLDDVCRKMIRRHPHIFGDVHAETSEEVLQNWEAIKKQEKSLQSQAGVMRDVPRSFPALMRAAQGAEEGEKRRLRLGRRKGSAEKSARGDRRGRRGLGRSRKAL